MKKKIEVVLVYIKEGNRGGGGCYNVNILFEGGGGCYNINKIFEREIVMV